MLRLQIVFLPKVMPSWRRGGNKRDAGAEMEKNDNEANGTQEEVTLQSLMEFAISMHEKLETALEGLANDPEREEGEGEKLQGNDEDGEDHLLELASRLETGMKCFQRQVETTDKRVENLVIQYDALIP